MSESLKEQQTAGKTSRRDFLKLTALAGGILGASGIFGGIKSQAQNPNIVPTGSKTGNLPLSIVGYPFDRVKGLVD